MRHGDSKYPLLVPLLLAVLAGLLFAFQYQTLAKFSILPPGRSFGAPLHFYQVLAERINFDFIDALLAALLLLAWMSFDVVKRNRREGRLGLLGRFVVSLWGLSALFAGAGIYFGLT